MMNPKLSPAKQVKICQMNLLLSSTHVLGHQDTRDRQQHGKKEKGKDKTKKNKENRVPERPGALPGVQ